MRAMIGEKIQSKKDKFVSGFKTKRINLYTGGKISDYHNEGITLSKGGLTKDNTLQNSFLSQGGEYIGDYKRGWWYFKQNLKVCEDHPHGVAIVVKDITEPVSEKNITGYYGFSHRGGNTFKIGDRFFDEKYKPKKEDYTPKEWSSFEKKWMESIKSDIKSGWYKDENEAKKNKPLSDVIPFRLRGKKVIKTWDDAKLAAKNMSSYLS